MKKTKAIDYEITGIKCDNPDCSYEDENARYEDYKKWLNKPCPLCGEILLTKKDYKAVRRLKRIVAIINIFSKPLLALSNGQKVKQTIEMNGSGKMYFKPENKN